MIGLQGDLNAPNFLGTGYDLMPAQCTLWRANSIQQVEFEFEFEFEFELHVRRVSFMRILSRAHDAGGQKVHMHLLI